MAKSSPSVAMQFAELDQQREAATLGMWIFLATEALFFGGLFLGYTAYRYLYPDAFAEMSHHMNVPIGTINTAVLLASSWFAALAVGAAKTERHSRVLGCLIAVATLGIVFDVLKFYEYYLHYKESLVPALNFRATNTHGSHVELFLWMYFVMTGVHALHVFIGVGLFSVMALLEWRRRRFSDGYFVPVENVALYWHFVDIVWIFLYPLFYLGR